MEYHNSTKEDFDQLIKFHCFDLMIEMLTSPVTKDDIKNALVSMPSEKTPRPDGFTKEFYIAAWSIIGKNFVTSVQSYFEKRHMPSGVNATILALIPKKFDTQNMKYFRLIACCNAIYKVISKILANRLKTLLPEAIQPNQILFIKGCLLLKNVLLATELVKDYHKDSISPWCALKIDITKAFDTVRWEVLKIMGIPEIFIHWIKGCISTTTFSVSLNGELEGFFANSRGLRQGCSLSPLLFVLSINVLSHRIDKGGNRESLRVSSEMQGSGDNSLELR